MSDTILIVMALFPTAVGFSAVWYGHRTGILMPHREMSLTLILAELATLFVAACIGLINVVRWGLL